MWRARCVLKAATTKTGLARAVVVVAAVEVVEVVEVEEVVEEVEVVQVMVTHRRLQRPCLQWQRTR